MATASPGVGATGWWPQERGRSFFCYKLGGEFGGKGTGCCRGTPVVLEKTLWSFLVPHGFTPSMASP